MIRRVNGLGRCCVCRCCGGCACVSFVFSVCSWLDVVILVGVFSCRGLYQIIFIIQVLQHFSH